MRAEGANYAWEYSQAAHRFRLFDSQGRVAAAGILQPAVIVHPGTYKQARKCTSGNPAEVVTKDNSVTVNYEEVSGGGRLSVTWRFEEKALWLEPIIYECAADENVVELHYFATGTGDAARRRSKTFT